MKRVSVYPLGSQVFFCNPQNHLSNKQNGTLTQQHETHLRSYIGKHNYPPRKLTSHVRRGVLSKGNFIFQPVFSRGYSFVFGGVNLRHIHPKKCTLPETNSSHLKIDGWNTRFPLGWPIFRCKKWVSGRFSPKLIRAFLRIFQKIFELVVWVWHQKKRL